MAFPSPTLTETLDTQYSTTRRNRRMPAAQGYTKSMNAPSHEAMSMAKAMNRGKRRKGKPSRGTLVKQMQSLAAARA